MRRRLVRRVGRRSRPGLPRHRRQRRQQRRQRGSEEQKQRYLPKIASGELRLQAFGVTEPTVRSDTTQIQTTGAVIGRPGRPFTVVGITVTNGRITEMDFVLDPAKLARITVD